MCCVQIVVKVDRIPYVLPPSLIVPCVAEPCFNPAIKFLNYTTLPLHIIYFLYPYLEPDMVYAAEPWATEISKR